MCQTWVKILY